ncbi:TerB family tellurite resistance protein, partial [Gammaproteobacteria bacterium]|nr:TerB family tellurite resistance protein [Gammaproteobacteria bacterium]
MNILKFFKKNNQAEVENENNEFDYDLLSVYLAYEVARADGDIDLKEMAVLKDFVKSSLTDNRNIDDVISDIEQYSQDNASLHDLITEINSSFNKKEKHSL